MDPNLQSPTPQEPLSDDEPIRNEQSYEADKNAETEYFNEETYEQPYESSDASSEPVMPDAFGLPPHDNTSTVSSENESPTPPPPPQTVAETTTLAESATPQKAMKFPAKKSRLLIWIVLGVVLLVCIALVAGYFVVKGIDNTSAQTYTNDVKNYVGGIYADMTVPAATPADINSSLSTRKAPVLKPALIAGISSEYKTAETLKNYMTSKVGSLTTKINDYSKIATFYKTYDGLYASLQLRDPSGTAILASHNKVAITGYLGEFLTKLQGIDKLLKGTSVPADLETDFKEMSRVYDAMTTNWGAMASAYSSGNTIAYEDAYTKFTGNVRELGKAKQPISTYANSLFGKTQATAKEFKAYADTIK
ncbi:MAG: hypothetical protein ABI716_00830 [Candidatus Saccharibacteria bacterium]